MGLPVNSDGQSMKPLLSNHIEETVSQRLPITMISLYLIGLNKKRNLVSLFHLLTRSGTGGCRFKGPEEGSLKEELYPCYLHDQINFHFYFAEFEIVARFNRCAQAMGNLPHLVEDDWIRLA